MGRKRNRVWRKRARLWHTVTAPSARGVAKDLIRARVARLFGQHPLFMRAVSRR
jgi:hypothetical protein